MWGEKSISSSWNYDPNCLKNLTCKKNIVEFIDRTEGGHWFVTSTIENIESVLSEHEITINNHFPSGVGGLTFSAIDKDNKHCILKFYMTERQFLNAQTSTQLLYESGLGPKIIINGANYLVFEAVSPGTPLRSKSIDFKIMKKLILDLEIISKIKYLKSEDKNKWYTDLEESLSNLSNIFHESNELLNLLKTIKVREVGFSHGDAQLGNILIKEEGYSWIDPEAELAPKETDLARLYTHTCADLIGNDPDYDIKPMYEIFKNESHVDINTFLILSCIKSFKSYISLGYGSTKREWEAKANYKIYKNLLSKIRQITI